ncbi:hypothetical protein Glove_126g6 [Diversispora epigaea]|uniref:Uncharacterized protein n=1 Tax=Diversispora epigaea TaxID=1348612 RepID=A0A397IYE0_9GLOM|nr:hypothetical protein Glove_126g6 [Diversispora epigaea]
MKDENKAITTETYMKSFNSESIHMKLLPPEATHINIIESLTEDTPMAEYLSCDDDNDNNNNVDYNNNNDDDDDDDDNDNNDSNNNDDSSNNNNNNYNDDCYEMFEGDLSDVSSCCSDCESLSNNENDTNIDQESSIDVSNLVGFTNLNDTITQAFIYKLKEYQLYKTMAILIKSGKLRLDQNEIPKKVRNMIERKGDNIPELENIREVFYKETEAIKRNWMNN